jgi:titin
VIGTPANSLVTLNWNPPASNGGSAITDFLIQYSTNEGSSWTAFNDGVAAVTSTKVTGLTNGTPYVFRVAAVNDAGVSAWSTASLATAPKAVPGAPASVVGVPADRKVSLSWTAPAIKGKPPITDYIIQSSADNGRTWTAFSDGVSTATAATITGLANGTPYLFRLAAVNALGASDWASTSASITPRTVASVPTLLTGVPGNGQVSLAWAAPASDGGAAITDYLIQVSTNKGAKWSTLKDAVNVTPTATVTGLSNGTAYVFRVAAINSAGNGSWSAVSALVTPRTTPSAPTAVFGVPGNGQVTLNWKAPTSNGGASVSDYLIQFSADAGKTWATPIDGVSSVATAIVSGLANGTPYVFRVAAVNAAGGGAWSAPSPVLAPRTVAAAPTGVSVMAGSGRATLKWTAPASDGGSSITDYRIQYSRDGGKTWATFADPVSTTPTATVTRLIKGTRYVYRVAAMNAAGTGSFSSPSDPTLA